MVSELKGYLESDETAGAAERQTKHGVAGDDWMASMAPMASMASMVVWTAREGAGVEVPLVPMVVASNGAEW